MNQEQRSTYSDKHLRRMNRFESTYRREVYLAIRSQILAFTSDLKENGLDFAIKQLDRTILNERIAPVIRDMYVEVGVYFARKGTREINKSLREQKGFGFDEGWVQSILQYFKLHLLSKAVMPISATTKQQILDIISTATEEGWGAERIVRELESSDLTLARALNIVRTEMVKAMAYGHELAERTSKWETEETWIATKDHRTRHSHRLMDGETILTGGRFKVPIFKQVGKTDIQIGWDMMKGPGDINASIGNIANCRCTKIVRARRDEAGNLIPKRSVSVIRPGDFIQPRQTITI